MKNKKLIMLSFAVLSTIITGCKPTPMDTHPANMVGNWKAEFTTKIHPNLFLPEVERDADVTINLTSKMDGSANFDAIESIQGVKSSSPQTETISGSWKLADDYLIIERPNGGFVAFRISSQSTNQLTVFTQTGQTIQFNRIP